MDRGYTRDELNRMCNSMKDQLEEHARMKTRFLAWIDNIINEKGISCFIKLKELRDAVDDDVL